MLSLAGCAAPTTATRPESEPQPQPPTGGGEYQTLRVYYGTDRKASGLTSPAGYYGAERGQFELGVCEMRVPPERLIDPKSREFLSLEAFTNRLKRVTVEALRPLDRGDFFAHLQLDVQTAPRNDAFVFIHGYNVSFDEAVRRTAQIAHDIGFGGVPIVFSWPSQGRLMDYTVDENNVEWAASHLKEFLDEIAAQAGAQTVHLVAHSMGTRALAAALRDLAAERPGERLFREVILAAPDIDAEIFRRDVVPRILQVAGHITLYASSGDEALSASRKVHGYARAGESGEGLVVMHGVDTVDASEADGTLFGHSYYGDSRRVVMDLHRLLIRGETIAERDLLPQSHDGRTYWTFPEK